MNTVVPQREFYLNVLSLKIKLKNLLFRRQFERYLKEQKALQDSYDLSEIRKAQKIVLFVLPSEEVVSGGILSIFSLCHYTRKILPDHLVLLVTEAGNKTYAGSSWFCSDEKIYRWEQVIDSMQNAESVIVHVPEYMSGEFYGKLPESSRKVLKELSHLIINVLNQNSQMLPPVEKTQKLFELSPTVTQTLAFSSKNIQKLANQYQMPITTIFSYLDLSKWKPILFSQKEKLILLSPDKNVYRKNVVKVLKKGLPDFELVTIKNVCFEQYMSLVCRAFAVISFGEGFDGYFLQPSFVKTMSFAVYNETFFPNNDFLALPNIYVSYAEMSQNIVRDIQSLVYDQTGYYETIRTLRSMDTEHSEQRLIELLTRFYRQDYECTPKQGNDCE